MGGDYYDRPVQVASAGDYSDQASQVVGKVQEMHKAMNPERWGTTKLPCNHLHPIVFALDVTGSMGDWSKIIYDKMPMFYGQIMIQGYLSDPSISFCAIGDAQYDRAPLQITEFGQGKEIDQLIAKMFLEGGGGGNGVESYELSAYFYSRHCELTDTELPFFFVTGDEDFYSMLDGTTVQDLIGGKLTEEELMTGIVDGEKIWRELMKKFNVFHIKKPYPEDSKNKSIKEHWIEAIGQERVLEIENPKASIDVMLGAIAITSGARNLKTYIKDMEDRGQTQERIQEVTRALKLYDEKPKKIVKYQVSEEIKLEKLGLDDEESKESPEEKLKRLRREYGKSMSWEGDEKKLREDMVDFKKRLGGDVPSEFICPITGEIFVDPVMTVDGHSYERKAIELWLRDHDTSPLTNVRLASKALAPNLMLKKLVQDYYHSNK